MTDSQDPQAILERIVEAERQVRRQARDLDQLLDWLEVAERDLQATLGSWRWRLGDRLVRAVEILLGRRRPSLAMDHLVSIFAEIRCWRQTRGERSYAIACGEDVKDLELNLDDTENLERVLFVANSSPPPSDPFREPQRAQREVRREDHESGQSQSLPVYTRQATGRFLDGCIIWKESKIQPHHRIEAIEGHRSGALPGPKPRSGYILTRQMRVHRLLTVPPASQARPRVGFLVTDADPGTSVGDYFTALELADALKTECGWETRFLALRGAGRLAFDLGDIDILIVMVDEYDLRDARLARPGLIRIAWLRNWFQRWVARPWFDEYDLIFCSSRRAAGHLRQFHGKEAWVLRIATNPMRFSPVPGAGPDPDPDLPRDAEAHKTVDLCFTGNYWGAEREIAELDPDVFPGSFALYGQGWGQYPHFKPYWRGFLPYAELPGVYRQARMLLDDANHVTKPWASVNSRVFDALASGVLTITNGVAGATEVFGDLLPCYRDQDELRRQLAYWLGHPRERLARVAHLRSLVLERHTYAHRARALQARLVSWSRKR